jgi:FkbM family methyltransferase
MDTSSKLNYFHDRGYYRLLCVLSSWVYFLKGYGVVKVKYHPEYRAYEYRIKNVTYLSIGPGWAYSYDYLKENPEKIFCFKYVPKKGDCVLDIGAGLGEETVILAQLVGVQGRVISIEANPVVFGGLKYMCDKNNFDWVTTLNLAVYSSNTDVMIEDNESIYLGNSIAQTSALGHRVPAKTLDAIIEEQGITKIDFLKCNIEGAEQYLIQGMTNSSPLIKNLCISCHDFRHVNNNDGQFYLTKQKVKEYLLSQGFNVVTRQTGIHHVDDYLYATRENFN